MVGSEGRRDQRLNPAVTNSIAYSTLCQDSLFRCFAVRVIPICNPPWSIGVYAHTDAITFAAKFDEASLEKAHNRRRCALERHIGDFRNKKSGEFAVQLAFGTHLSVWTLWLWPREE